MSISRTIHFVSFINLKKRNAGCYSSPFSGVGAEFFPLGILPDHSGLVLHEAGFVAQNNWWNFPNTLSPFWRLYYNFKKGHKVVFRNFEKELTPEHMVLIPDHQLFDSVGTRPVPHFWVTFSLASRLDIHQEIPIILTPERYELDIIRKITALFNDTANCLDRKKTYNMCIALLNIVLCRKEIRWQTNDSPMIEKASHFIEQNYTSAISIRETARKSGMSYTAFIRAFRRYQGVKPVRFLMQVRTRQAADLLVNTNLPIEDVAEKTGFPNRAYLSRVFKKITGTSPALFRKTHSPS
ncbi:MAG: hypothetical protein A2283_22920 [Lentisphaerae bacterium RIFOXYA12_FULL_48_11]|nr:MAG: hypothetical protein A2283_22920 [Lentisphaerae bacterium RIFOXYA12_FULL_48_11]